ncbi:MAG: hypothetical protein AB8B61_07050 [Cyclobacteriaceae bacterium]
MKSSLKIISWLSLVCLVALPSILNFTGSLSFSVMKTIMFIGTALWFVTAPFWMINFKKGDEII